MPIDSSASRCPMGSRMLPTISVEPSNMIMFRPRLCLRAIFFPAASPTLWSQWITRKVSWEDWNSSSHSAVPSVDPLSTTIISLE